MNDAIEVEVNLMESRKIKHKLNSERKKAKEESQHSSFHSSYDKFDTMMKIMEKLMERLVVGERPTYGQQQETHIRNPNFRSP